MLSTMFYDILQATMETIYMVTMSSIFSVILGLFLGTLLFSLQRLSTCSKCAICLSGIINMSRSIPFIILLVLVIPLTRLIVGTSIGTHAMIVPLTLGATPFFARLVTNIYHGIPSGLIEAGYTMGANSSQMITRILLPEARVALIQAI